jgi:uncharacterized protein (DUF1684 family)
VIAMQRLWASIFVLAALATGCSRERWPSPPAVDPGAYQKEHDAWLEGERAYLSEVLPVIGIWPLDEGATAFGSDRSLSIVLPAAQVPALAGTFRRAGDSVTVIPAADFDLRTADGSRLDGERQVTSVLAGPLRLDVAAVGDDRRWVAATDTTHPAVTAPPPIPSYPVDDQWRVLARFDAFEPPKRVRVADVRGGSMEAIAAGELVFPLGGEERRLTAMRTKSGHFAVWFKDRTNGSTTYGGYRVVRPQAVEDGGWTIIDFNFAYNPPCAYSIFTTCPLSPPENRLPVAVEAGLKQLPSVKGY